MTLVDFYTPLGPKNLLIFAAWLICFDVLGEWIGRRLVAADKKFAPTRWLYGMAFFVCVWYFLGFFIIPKGNHVTLSLLFLTAPFLPAYIRSRNLWLILGGWRKVIPVLLLALPLLPIFWVKGSLPPYQWDELAYHYSSPWGYNHLGLRHLTDGFYENIPRLYDTLYSLIFNTSKTYSISRLLHFTTYFSVLIYVFHWLKRTSSTPAAVFFVILMLYVPADLSTSATSGYVDIAANSFVLAGTIATLEYVAKTTPLTVPIAFWAMALGTRYNSLIPFLSVVLIVTPWCWRRIFTKAFLRQLVPLSTIFILFGGFWYIKNTLLTGNPIFPFLLPCYRFQDTCQSMKGFLGDWWLIKVDFKNLPDIIYYILAGSKSIAVISGFCLFLATQLKKNYRLNTWFLLAYLILNFILIKYLSGFLFRYFIYTQYLIFLITALVLGQKQFTHRIFTHMRWLVLGLAVLFILRQVPRSILRAYSQEKLPKEEISFVLGQTSIYDWANFLFPKSGPLIRWCDRSEITEEIPITFYDPDITWYQFEGRFNGYLHKCAIVPPPEDSIEDPKVGLNRLVATKAEFYLVSLAPCTNGKIMPDMQETPVALSRRVFSDLLVCNSQPVDSVPTLYRFDGNYLNAF